jgi:hypothetical protein
MSSLRAHLVTLWQLATLLGCDGAKTSQPAPPDGMWRHISEIAPYQLTLADAWQREDIATVNAHADLAASMGGELLLVVIPQRLPAQQMGEGEEAQAPTDATTLKDLSIELLREQTPDFTLEREGPVVLDNTPGHVVWAEGMSEDARVQYLLTYVVRDGWGFQIVAVAPADQEKRLADEVDRALRAWRFTPSAAGPTTSAPPAAN